MTMGLLSHVSHQELRECVGMCLAHLHLFCSTIYQLHRFSLFELTVDDLKLTMNVIVEAGFDKWSLVSN